MTRSIEWIEDWSESDAGQATLFEQDLFGAPRRRSANGLQNAEVAAPIAPAQAPLAAGVSPAAPSPTTGTSIVLKHTRVRLPTIGEEFDLAKILDTTTDRITTRATGTGGQPVDAPRKIADERRAWLRRNRQVHPSLAAALARARPMERLRVMVWLYVAEEEFDKSTAERERPRAPLVASAESVIQSPPERGVERDEDSDTNPPPHPRMLAYRQQVEAVVERATRELPRATQVRVIDRVGMVPGLAVEATAAQVRALSRRREVAGLFLYEPKGIPDLTDSMRIARATPVVDAGWRGTNVRVALWEEGPDVLTDLRIAGFYDTAQTDKSDHARLTTAIIKNRQTSGRHGYAPRCKTFSANSYDLKALDWAVVTKRCRVINQSFHRDSEETSDVMSFDDLAKDYYATRYPFPTIVQAAGNQSTPSTEFVNHKGYNSVVVGNHDDAARLMRPLSVFLNPTSTHNDRELPDICANGDNVTAVGLTKGGTSFASPAVAGTVALLQRAAPTLASWPEGCRAILLAGAGRNVRGDTWWNDVSHRVDGRDGAGALDTRESLRIARTPAPRNAPASRCGWDVGTLLTRDLDANGRSAFRHQVVVPAGDKDKPVRVALAWSSKVTYDDDPTATPPIKNVKSTLTVDLDLHVYEGTRHVAWSSSFDNSYEVVDFQGRPGTTYDIVIRRWSGTDWVWYGVAWAVF